MNLFVDLDGVLVRQTGRDGFDTMPWMEDGKELWEYIKAFQPTILSQLSPDIYDRGSQQKRVWCDRELGIGVKLIVVRADTFHTAKFVYAGTGAVLIDDHPAQHREAWERRGGIFIPHQDADSTIEKLCSVLGVDRYEEQRQA